MTHDHLATIDFRSGMIYHYYDPENTEDQKLLDVYRIKKSEMDEDTEMLAKKQFEKWFKATDHIISTNKYSKYLDIKRGTNEKTSKAKLMNYIKRTMKSMDSLGLKKSQSDEYGTLTQSEMYFILSIMEEKNNESLFFLEKSDEIEAGYIRKSIIKALSSRSHIIGQSGYTVDYEGYLHPVEHDRPIFDTECAIKLTKNNFLEVSFEFTDDEVEELKDFLFKRHT